MKPIRVLLAEDHAIVRAGLRSLLEKLPNLQVVAEADDGGQVLDRVRLHLPDVVLMDIAMPNLNGLEVTARVAAEFPSVRVIILSMHANEEYALQALRAGAYGYVLKRSAFDELVSAIQAVAQGGTYFCAPIARQLADITVEDLQAWEAPLGRLTLRQREVLQLIAEGKNTKEMAHLLNVSTKTVEFHRAQLMKRLSIYDVAGVVRFAIRSGVIPPE